ncbi:MAG: Rpn family recombination-promoting nuclease/putative transposase [Rickettsiales bacterium]|jgi:predicted transposase/invertase (TIGR01784 family)|nr:Rpn family recombination-promoting nuclease/putative transposase [Rickettsiales bacterium]
MESEKESKKLLSVTADFVFKHIFGLGEHKRILVSLLNSILRGEPEIESLELINPEIPRDRENGKDIRLDILARTPRGTILNIEIQCKNYDDILNRAAFYQYRIIPRELDSGQNYNSIPDVISIWITDFPIFADRKYHLNEITNAILNNGIDPMEVGTRKFRTLTLELTKMKYAAGDMMYKDNINMLHLWMTFIKHPAIIPEDIINRVPEIGEAMTELKKISGDKNFRIQYDAYLMAKNDRIAAETTAMERGIEKGIEKGRKEGKRDTALLMLRKNMDLELVAECTGLDRKELLGLKETLKVW